MAIKIPPQQWTMKTPFTLSTVSNVHLEPLSLWISNLTCCAISHDKGSIMSVKPSFLLLFLLPSIWGKYQTSKLFISHHFPKIDIYVVIYIYILLHSPNSRLKYSNHIDSEFSSISLLDWFSFTINHT